MKSQSPTPLASTKCVANRLTMATGELLKAIEHLIPNRRSLKGVPPTFSMAVWGGDAVISNSQRDYTCFVSEVQWEGTVTAPIRFLLALYKAPPNRATLDIRFDGSFLCIDLFRVRGQWLPGTTFVPTTEGLGKLEKAPLRFCTACAKHRGEAQSFYNQRQPADLIELATSEPLICYRCQDCAHRWLEWATSPQGNR